MVSDPYVAGSRTPLFEVTEKMASEKIGSAVVIDDEDQVLGIFTTTDALELLTEMLQEDESSGRRELTLLERWVEWDASMGE